MTTNEIVIQRMNAFIQSKNISPEEMSEKLGVDLKIVKLWIEGKRVPKLVNIYKFIHTYKCKSDYLFGLRDEP